MSVVTPVVQSNTQAKYSLSHLTLIGCSTPELVYIASRTGYDAVSLRLLPMGVDGEFPGSPIDKALLKATENALEVTGLEIHDIELVCIKEGFDLDAIEPIIAAGAQLGAKKLITSAWTKGNDHNFIVDCFSQVCELARTYQIDVALEFPTFSRLGSLQEAVEVVRSSEQPNAEILVDTIYIHLSQVNLDELRVLPADWFSFVQISDISYGIPVHKEEMVKIARNTRLYPGEGCLNFGEIKKSLPAPCNFSIELPNKNRAAELGFEGHARRALQQAKQALEA